jgi:hypothetical protein
MPHGWAGENLSEYCTVVAEEFLILEETRRNSEKKVSPGTFFHRGFKT